MPSVFLSHSSADKATMKELKKSLEKYGIRVWLDENMIVPADPFIKRMDQGLDTSDFVVLWLTAKSLESPFVEHEWKSVLANQLILVEAEDNLKIPDSISKIKPIKARGKSIDEVAQKIAKRVFIGYENETNESIVVEKPPFNSNCRALWASSEFSKALEDCHTGTVVNNGLDKQFCFSGSTNAKDGAIIKFDIRVEGTGSKLWAQEGGVVACGKWKAKCFLRKGSTQKTELIFSLYEEEPRKLLSRRTYVIE